MIDARFAKLLMSKIGPRDQIGHCFGDRLAIEPQLSGHEWFGTEQPGQERLLALALQAGAAFTFDYEATSTADSPALYTILQKTGSTKGTVSGLYAPDALQLSITAPGAVIPADPLTRVYVSGSETLPRPPVITE